MAEVKRMRGAGDWPAKAAFQRSEPGMQPGEVMAARRPSGASIA